MSNQRPSTSQPNHLPLSAPHLHNSPKSQSRTRQDPWLKRIFHSTYTRNGRRVVLNGWSVRIQHAGLRRTFSLASSTKAGAAAEARTIYATICAGGWDTVKHHYRGGRRGPTFPRDDPRWWEDRLLVRNHPEHRHSSQNREFSVRIEHAGTSCYFPLATNIPNQASPRALAIYRTVVDHGWDAAWQIFPREITIAFRWAFHPLLWTYSTLHTLPQTPASPHADSPKVSGDLKPRILLLESDPGTRASLTRCIETDSALRCMPCQPADLKQPKYLSQSRAVLCLVNLNLADTIAFNESNQIGTLPKGIPLLGYSVHKDSEELFAVTPGGAFAYVLRRTASDKLLEPVRSTLLRQPCNSERLLQTAKRYFLNLLETTSPKKNFAPAQLTQREHQVIDLMSKGMIDKEIAQTLGISSWTVHEHVKRIFDKLHVHSRTELVLSYLQK